MKQFTILDVAAELRTPLQTNYRSYVGSVRERKTLESERQAKIDEINEQFEDKLLDVKEREAAALDEIMLFLEEKGDKIFTGDIKTLQVGSGKVAVQQQPEKVVLQDDEDLIIDSLEDSNFCGYVRVKKSIDKQAIMRDHKAGILNAGIFNCGINITTSTKYIIE